jgi:hypothetical protein
MVSRYRIRLVASTISVTNEKLKTKNPKRSLYFRAHFFYFANIFPFKTPKNRSRNSSIFYRFGAGIF